MCKHINDYYELDEEWVQLIGKAKDIGLSPDEVISFLVKEERRKE
ncbi:hypothetical protein J2S78_003232 [Salibacterium salarium]|nr:anti-repressor SinI family protein [Salibacterium salarium]MDQ0300764.1 hypothetical protein [Salibacterium salarium]